MDVLAWNSMVWFGWLDVAKNTSCLVLQAGGLPVKKYRMKDSLNLVLNYRITTDSTRYGWNQYHNRVKATQIKLLCAIWHLSLVVTNPHRNITSFHQLYRALASFSCFVFQAKILDRGKRPSFKDWITEALLTVKLEKLVHSINGELDVFNKDIIDLSQRQ